MIQRPRGTRDFPPEECKQRKHVENMLRECAAVFGFEEIATPTFETEELFTERSGEGIIEQMYTFKDKKGRKLVLRPEITAAVMRFYYNELKMRPKPLKLCYFANCFRYERPQAGRYREFWQFGTELIGPTTPEADAEIIALAITALKQTGLEHFKVRIGHLGILRSILATHGLPITTQGPVMILIDKGTEEHAIAALVAALEHEGFDPGAIEDVLTVVKCKVSPYNISRIQSIIDRYPKSVNAFEKLVRIIDYLKYYQIDDYLLDFGIVRGLDYYTGMVFEIDYSKLGAEKQICGGGAYQMGEIFTERKSTVNGTGFGIGFDRLLLCLKHENIKFQDRPLQTYIVPITAQDHEYAFQILTMLRKNNIFSDIDLIRKKMKKNLQYANKKGIEFVIIIGWEEIKKDSVKVRNMKSGEEEFIQRNNLIFYLNKKLKND